MVRSSFAEILFFSADSLELSTKLRENCCMAGVDLLRGAPHQKLCPCCFHAICPHQQIQTEVSRERICKPCANHSFPRVMEKRSFEQHICLLIMKISSDCLWPLPCGYLRILRTCLHVLTSFRPLLTQRSVSSFGIAPGIAARSRIKAEASKELEETKVSLAQDEKTLADFKLDCKHLDE